MSGTSMLLAALTTALWMMTYGSAREDEAIQITFRGELQNPQIAFAASEILSASLAPGAPLGELTITFLIDATRLPPQAYEINRVLKPLGFIVTGGDATGAMYGGLDIAEALRIGTVDQLAEGIRRPYIERRGIKFNIPLDVRTPSYSDNGDSFQANIPEVWSKSFWHEMLDEMARNRYNVLTLWNLHPFPSIVRVPEFPDIALADVWRTRVKLDDTFAHTGRDMVRPEMLRDVEVVRRMSIDEKIAFWRHVMEYAQHRGIESLLVHLEYFCLGNRRKIRHHGRSQQSHHNSLFSGQCAGDGPHLSTAGRHRYYRRREHGPGRIWAHKRTVVVANVWGGNSGCLGSRTNADFSAHPPFASDKLQRDPAGV